MQDLVRDYLEMAADFWEAGDFLSVQQILASPVVLPVLDLRNRAMLQRANLLTTFFSPQKRGCGPWWPTWFSD